MNKICLQEAAQSNLRIPGTTDNMATTESAKEPGVTMGISAIDLQWYCVLCRTDGAGQYTFRETRQQYHLPLIKVALKNKFSKGFKKKILREGP